MIVRLLKGAFSYRTCDRLPSYYRHLLLINSQGLQIFLMSGVSVTSASQILESFWNVWRLSNTWSWHVYTIVRDTRSSCGGPLTWKAQIPDGGHRINFDRNLPSSCLVVQYNSLILMIK